jgi:SNF2 family DNA or RNA helicase
MHLLDRSAFPSLAEFESRFCPGGALEASRMPALAKAIKPYLLRRMKEDVENIPEKEEVVVWVEMTADQRSYYKALHESKMHVLLASHSRKNMPNSRNLLMELRHCCNHPFLLVRTRGGALSTHSHAFLLLARRTASVTTSHAAGGRWPPPPCRRSLRRATPSCSSRPPARWCCSPSYCPSSRLTATRF